jgi:hypothetical protein
MISITGRKAYHAVIYVPREGSGGVFMNPTSDIQNAF